MAAETAPDAQHADGSAAEIPEPPEMAALLQGVADVISRAELADRLRSGRRLRVKLGLDPTASDLHLGHAVVLRTLRRFQDAGHLAVLIVGDFTAQVGDPTGRSATRPPLTKAQVDAAAQTYLDQVTRVLDPDPAKLEVRRNSEWLGTMGIDDVLRLTARSTVARMLERNDFSQRYADGSPISITEFLYPLLQGWDSVMVDADVELGGTDQLFNLLMGRQLQAQEGREQQVVVTTPILVGLAGPGVDGPKMSKSLGNYVGLSEPANEQFGKLMSIPDALLDTYVQYATGWEQARIDEAIAARVAGTLHPNAAKRAMAAAVCDLYHGAGAGAAAEAEFDRVHKHHDAPTDMPEVALPADLGATVSAARLLVVTGLAASGREGARLVREGAVRIDGSIVDDSSELDVEALRGSTLQVGRRRWARLR